MDWLTFIATVIVVLAWPTAIVVAVLLVRRPVASMLPLLRRLRYGELEAEFAEDLKQAQEAVKALPPEPRAPTPEGAVLSHLEELAALSPRAAVVESWRQLNEAARAAVERLHLAEAPDKLSPRDYPALLANRGILDSELFDVFHRLRTLRNKAAHGGSDVEITRDDALEYISLVEALSRRLASARAR